MVGQRRGRLVHLDDPGVEADRLGDLHDLLLGHRQAADPLTGADAGDAEAGEQLLGVALHRRGVDGAAAAGLAAEVDVLGDRALRQQVELLEDRRDAGVLGLERVTEASPPRRPARSCRRRAGRRPRAASSGSTCRRRSPRPGRAPARRAARGRRRRGRCGRRTTWSAPGPQHDVPDVGVGGRQRVGVEVRGRAHERHCGTRHCLLSSSPAEVVCWTYRSPGA